MERLRYRLSLSVRADRPEFEATVTVSADAFPPELTLDSVGLEIRSVRTGSTALDHLRPDDAHLRLPSIPAGTASLTIDFGGRIDPGEVRGFYASPYGPGQLYSTYFEPAGARRLLPCLDRPDAKAVFEVDVTAPRDRTVLSNTPAVGADDLPDGRRRTRFAPTPSMSTYLLYIGIGPFEERAGTGTAPRVIVATPPGRSAHAGFALAQGERAVDYFTRYYAVPYPLPKLHLIAVPQLGTGAMENWGAITFQEYLIVVEEPASVSTKSRALEVICHEIAHQWFGNLVTMRAWTDLWLNESFASLVAIQAADELAPEWTPWDDFLAQRYAGAMTWDALPHTHPIRVDVTDPLEVRQIFDEISYGKGASVLRMAEADVGRDVFRAGVTQYLTRHREGNAESDDLWRAVAAAAGAPVDRTYGEWVRRPGFPIVRVERDGAGLSFAQHRFWTLGGPEEPPWPIPLAVRASDGTHRLPFTTGRARLASVGPGAIVNPGRTGFYRVEYVGALRDEQLTRFAEQPAVDRWGFLNDERALLLAGRRSLDEYLDAFRRLGTDRDPLVVGEALDVFRGLYPVIARIPRWHAALRDVLGAQSERLGVDAPPSESDRDRLLREAVTFARVRVDPPFAASLAARYSGWERLEPELRRPVAAAYAVGAGPAERDRLLADLARASSGQEKATLAAALGLLPQGEWVADALGLVFSGELFLGPWVGLVGSAVMINPGASDAVFRFLTGRFDEFVRITAGSSLQNLVLQIAVPNLGLGRSDEMRAWVARGTFPESAQGAAKGLDLLAVYERLLRAAGDGRTTAK